MAATPEILKPEAPMVTERQEEFIVPETLQSSGVKVVQKNFKAQVNNNKGQPVVATLPTQVVSVTPPSDDSTLLAWSKGETTRLMSWLVTFSLLFIKNATHVGCQIVGRGQK